MKANNGLTASSFKNRSKLKSKKSENMLTQTLTGNFPNHNLRINTESAVDVEEPQIIMISNTHKKAMGESRNLFDLMNQPQSVKNNNQDRISLVP